MKISEIVKILDASVICGEEHLNKEIDKAFASDLMSDILTIGDNIPMIITGLCNMQTIRTCEMGSIDTILFIRKKKPTEEMIGLARDNDMIIIESDYSMFKACGLLWEAGIKPVY
ncbi:MAG: hypothetical protein ACI358_09010 [Candidatus Limimorpha sp.]